MNDQPTHNNSGRIRRRDVIGTLAASTLLAAAPARAAQFPDKPITLIVPWTPGGASDVLMRQLGQSVSKVIGQPVIIVNRPGAGGTVGPAQMAATARPDGYTVAQVATSLVRLPHLQSTSYDPLTDFTYIIGMSAWSTGLIVRNDSPLKKWEDVVAGARANPGKLSYATVGIGSSLHIYMEQITQAAGIQLLHVPYNGAAEQALAMGRGEVDMLAVDMGGAMASLEGGQSRLLLAWGAQRAARWPDVPTLREKGINVVATAPFGIAGPKGMAPDIVKKLHDAFNEARMDPAYKAMCDRLAFEDYYLNSQDFANWIKKTYADQGKSLSALGLAKKA